MRDMDEEECGFGKPSPDVMAATTVKDSNMVEIAGQLGAASFA